MDNIILRWVDATNGRDGNDGLTESTAWATLHKVLEEFLESALDMAAVTVIVGFKDGHYFINKAYLPPTGSLVTRYKRLYFLGLGNSVHFSALGGVTIPSSTYYWSIEFYTRQITIHTPGMFPMTSYGYVPAAYFAPSGFKSTVPIRKYPPSATALTVLATSTDANSPEPYCCCSKLVDSYKNTGPHLNFYGEFYNKVNVPAFSAGSASCVRFNIDYGEEIVATGLYFVNESASSFVLQGTNQAGSFSNTAYSDDTGWDTLTSGTFENNASDDFFAPTLITKSSYAFSNTSPYRYYSIKIADSVNSGTNIAFRKALIATSADWADPDVTIYRHIDAGAAETSASANYMRLYRFSAESTGWYIDTSFVAPSGATLADMTISDRGLQIPYNPGPFCCARALSPVIAYATEVSLTAGIPYAIAPGNPIYATPGLAVSLGFDSFSWLPDYCYRSLPVQGDVIVEYRCSGTEFQPSATDLPWLPYTAGVTNSVAGNYFQYRVTLEYREAAKQWLMASETV